MPSPPICPGSIGLSVVETVRISNDTVWKKVLLLMGKMLEIKALIEYDVIGSYIKKRTLA